jgi:hypothetical protein
MNLLRHLGNERKVHYLSPSEGILFGLDPFHGVTDTNEVCKVIEDTARAIVRVHGEYDLKQTTQLKRWLVNVLHVCRFCGMDKMLKVLNVRHPKWQESFNRSGNRIPEESAMDFMELKELPTKARRDEIQSTVNRLRTFLTPMVKQMFSRKRKPFSFTELVRNGEILIVSLGTSKRFSRDQSEVLAGLMMNGIFNACQTVSHPHHTLAIDEAGMFVGDDLSDALTRARHWGLSLWLGFQNTSCLKKEGTEAARQAMSQGQYHFAFRQDEPDEIDYLARMMTYKDYDFTEQMTPMQFFSHYDWVDVDEYSESEEMSASRSRTVSTTWNVEEGDTLTVTEGSGYREDEGEGESVADGVSVQDGISVEDGTSKEKGAGGSRALITTTSKTKSRGEKSTSGWQNTFSEKDDDRKDREGYVYAVGSRGDRGTESSEADGVSHGKQEGEDWKESQGVKHSEGVKHSDGKSKTLTVSTRRGRGWDRSKSLAKGKMRSQGHGGSEAETAGFTRSQGLSVHHKKVPLAQHELILWPTGKLKRDTAVQEAMRKKIIATLILGECMVMNPDGKVGTFQFPELKSEFCEEWLQWIEQDMKKRIAERPEYFRPVAEVWTGASVTTKSGRSRPSTPAPQGNGSKPGLSAITRLRQDVQSVCENAKDAVSRIVDPSSSETPEASPTCTADGNHKASSTKSS